MHILALPKEMELTFAGELREQKPKEMKALTLTDNDKPVLDALIEIYYGKSWDTLELKELINKLSQTALQVEQAEQEKIQAQQRIQTERKRAIVNLFIQMKLQPEQIASVLAIDLAEIRNILNEANLI